MNKFNELEKIVKKHFPEAKWDKTKQYWTATTTPNKKDKWDQPDTLVAFDKEASKKFYQYMSSNSWDDKGNIQIGVRSRIFEMQRGKNNNTDNNIYNNHNKDNTMTKSELRSLIKEELRKVLKEDTQLMSDPSAKAKVEQAIGLLQSIDIDGETMQYVLEKLGMGEQMQHQLTPGGIREGVRKTLKEAVYKPSYTHMKPFKMDIAKMISQLQDLNKKIEQNGPLSEEIQDAIESLGVLISNINIQTAKG